ncbi:hypothetical protein KZZ52_32415 [Dactylosporangium sp. AC04546]|uniref:hypothetical protein n=1 Tax=Dactylosporangium sp. AC04546 TaxID=2862460 RepID=UPI001EE0C7FC|nr:hypothetical protein [Dactylosporangium sp. AC04546]WVK78696.1 hypothetical protein KZZ52_32415 [Dactylosporangium sp. AC04546]
MAAPALNRPVRNTDRRPGGEEFVVLLPDATAGEARDVYDRMRRAASARRSPPGSPPSPTASSQTSSSRGPTRP